MQYAHFKTKFLLALLTACVFMPTAQAMTNGTKTKKYSLKSIYTKQYSFGSLIAAGFAGLFCGWLGVNWINYKQGVKRQRPAVLAAEARKPNTQAEIDAALEKITTKDEEEAQKQRDGILRFTEDQMQAAMLVLYRREEQTLRAADEASYQAGEPRPGLLKSIFTNNPF